MLMVAVAYKVALPQLRPFAYDASLMMLDRTLHGGRLPHEWLSLQPSSKRLLDAVYGSWYGLLGAWIIWIAACPDSPDRRRSLIAMALLWTGMGCIVALLLSSAGPCYYALVNGGGIDSPYAAELSRIRQLGLMATSIQDQLWRAHVEGHTDLVAGIASHPSLHVAIPALLALSTPRLRWLFVIVTVLMLIGSVALLWHYAVDGYAGILGAIACWWIAGRVTSVSRRPAPTLVLSQAATSL